MTFLLTPEQQRRGQINGARKGGPSFIHDLIIRSLRGGPKLRHEIAEDTERSDSVLAPILCAMLDARRIIVIGTAEQAGREAFRRRDARMYALPGTPMLPPFKPVSVTERVKNPAPLSYRHQIMREILAKNEAERATRGR